MEKRGKVALCLLTLMYFIGGMAGGICQVKLADQSEMYQYLKEAVSGYNLNIVESFISSAKDNVVELAVLIVSAFLPFGVWIFGAVLAVRGFFTAFAITASMRIYGICGLFLNAGSIISSLLVVPGIVCYGKFLYMGCCEKKGFKFLIVSLLFLSLILFLDCVMKGVVSPYIVKWWK